jgi:hypothetical protein
LVISTGSDRGRAFRYEHQVVPQSYRIWTETKPKDAVILATLLLLVVDRAQSNLGSFGELPLHGPKSGERM